eukprot:TRINITY_DN1087_c0_g2_i1.p1 TRINITY_DN1087_c0_g2~~TRINITY_DN1087_c0_g2_i1.p1  ORF type:complete len:104 (+),score=7.60 TRINITY_DN1087_c0_g2_i1:559-870(+)
MAAFTESLTILIPKKVKKITCFDNIHPISLCNVDYKIFSTILSNRVKKIINHVTCHILLLDYLMKSNRTGAFLWIDFSKAFDSISHEYLLSLIKYIGFSESPS